MVWFELVGGNTATAVRKTRNITLEGVEAIANVLDIDDYAILFEPIDDWGE